VTGNSPSFTATVSAITNAFGDPTRRGIYLFARETEGGVTAAQVADQFGVHPNVARHRVPADAKVDLSGAVSVRSDDLVLSLLGRALALLPREQAEQMAETVGQEYGRAMAHGLTGDDLAAGQRSLRSAIQAVADALTAHGFAAHADQRNNQLRIINHHCPFGDVAIENPVICAVDRGMVKGMLAALYGDADVNTLASLPQGDTFCDVGLSASL